MRVRQALKMLVSMFLITGRANLISSLAISSGPRAFLFWRLLTMFSTSKMVMGGGRVERGVQVEIG